jgi:hypothetical protein
MPLSFVQKPHEHNDYCNEVPLVIKVNVIDINVNVIRR